MFQINLNRTQVPRRSCLDTMFLKTVAPGDNICSFFCCWVAYVQAKFNSDNNYSGFTGLCKCCLIPQFSQFKLAGLMPCLSNAIVAPNAWANNEYVIYLQIRRGGILIVQARTFGRGRRGDSRTHRVNQDYRFVALLYLETLQPPGGCWQEFCLGGRNGIFHAPSLCEMRRLMVCSFWSLTSFPCAGGHSRKWASLPHPIPHSPFLRDSPFVYNKRWGTKTALEFQRQTCVCCLHPQFPPQFSPLPAM